MEKSIGSVGNIAVFWDKSFLWGLMAYATFRDLGLDFTLLTGQDIAAGELRGHDCVFVPGGWASDKIWALGQSGAEGMRAFVDAGGGYLGFCGGAGLALTHDSGLGLAPFGRLPSSIRVPSFSGHIRLLRQGSHPMWRGIPEGEAFSAWWPGQFAIAPDSGAQVLARYGRPVEGRAYVTDIPVVAGVDWEMWEKSYGINLDPARIEREPAVIETAFGNGRVVLSYPHFETSGDYWGHRVLFNLLAYVSGRDSGSIPRIDERTPRVQAQPAGQAERSGTSAATAITAELREAISGLITFGNLNFLWSWQAALVLKWRRGVRGIEYSTLYAMLHKLRQLAPLVEAGETETIARLEELRELVLPFAESARRLLMLERHAMGHGPLSPLKTDDPAIGELREKLFSTSKRCGGMYEQIVDLADSIMLPLLRRELEKAL